VNSYGSALRRNWWVVAIGVVVAIAVATWMAYEVPGFTPREKPVYTANARLLVTSSEGSYIRVSVPRRVDDESVSGIASDGSRVVNEPPDVRPLLAAANLYPLLIESDHVTKLRAEMFGPMAGTVKANAVSAVVTPTRYRPSQLPAIDIFATSSSAEKAVALANATSKSFKRWIQLEQAETKLKPRERIIIQELRVPTGAVSSGGPSFGIPVLAALAVLAGFGLLAVALDRIFVAPGVRTSETR
jgi:capsular polysaccharide biosynthesis protein